MTKERLVILGGGESGVGTALLGKAKGYEVFVSDKGKIKEKYKEVLIHNEIEWEDEQHAESKILNANIIMKSPGIPDKVDLIKQIRKTGIPIVSEIEFAAKFTDVTIVGITGSNGKTTTATLAHHILKQELHVGLAGNIGDSFAKQVLETGFDSYVLEISSFQLDDIVDFKPKIAVILNITPDHLDRYKNYQEYANSKLAVYNNSQRCVWNREDEWLQGVEYFSAKKNVVSFGVQSPKNETEFGIVDEQGERFFAKGQQKVCSIQQCNLIGTHNHLNVLAALALLSDFNIKPTTVEFVLKSFQGLEHRMQKVRERKGVCWVNDSKATNVGATTSAIEGLHTPTVLIAGGQGKGAEFETLLPAMKRYVKRAYIYGEDASEMYEHWHKDIDVILVDSLEVAVQEANQFVQSGDTVLLSPACASFDMFDSFVSRGERFIELVNAL